MGIVCSLQIVMQRCKVLLRITDWLRGFDFESSEFKSVSDAFRLMKVLTVDFVGLVMCCALLSFIQPLWHVNRINWGVGFARAYVGFGC
jgi:hypothetical protein